MDEIGFELKSDHDWTWLTCQKGKYNFPATGEWIDRTTHYSLITTIWNCFILKIIPCFPIPTFFKIDFPTVRSFFISQEYENAHLLIFTFLYVFFNKMAVSWVVWEGGEGGIFQNHHFGQHLWIGKDHKISILTESQTIDKRRNVIGFQDSLLSKLVYFGKFRPFLRIQIHTITILTGECDNSELNCISSPWHSRRSESFSVFEHTPRSRSYCTFPLTVSFPCLDPYHFCNQQRTPNPFNSFFSPLFEGRKVSCQRKREKCTLFERLIVSFWRRKRCGLWLLFYYEFRFSRANVTRAQWFPDFRISSPIVCILVEIFGLFLEKNKLWVDFWVQFFVFFSFT